MSRLSRAAALTIGEGSARLEQSREQMRLTRRAMEEYERAIITATNMSAGMRAQVMQAYRDGETAMVMVDRYEARVCTTAVATNCGRVCEKYSQKHALVRR